MHSFKPLITRQKVSIMAKFVLAYKVNIALLNRSIIEQLVVHHASYGLFKKPDVKTL